MIHLVHMHKVEEVEKKDSLFRRELCPNRSKMFFKSKNCAYILSGCPIGYKLKVCFCISDFILDCGVHV